jgi:23S rRNA U2552 (ribose-2'-O)-methylase RlmE/FtsJ
VKQSPKSEVQSPKFCLALAVWWLGLALSHGDDFAGLCESRTAIERVYYHHRLGQKPPFEQISPASLIERLVREELHKEAALKQVYGVEITPAMLEAEVQRINATTRAPEMLAEIKAALGKDPDKFANAFARPFLVERLLRERFENDDALHAGQRREAEKVREKLLEIVAADASRRTNGVSSSQRRLTSAATDDTVETLLAVLKTGHSDAMSETTWQLGARPAETNAPAADEREIKRRFGPNAQLISSPERDQDRKYYFEDLPVDLQRVLRVQLRWPGDVSAVIETPGGFLVYVAKEKTATALTVACLSLPKRDYEQWLKEQP